MPKHPPDFLNPSSAEVDKVLELLSEKGVANRRLNTLMRGLRNVGFDERENFKVGHLLAQLLLEPALFPGSCQRIAAIYMLYEMNQKLPVTRNPFACVFNQFLEPPPDKKATGGDAEGMGDASVARRRITVSRDERTFLAQLVATAGSGAASELSGKTPQKIVAHKYKQRHHSAEHQLADISSFRQSLTRNQVQRTTVTRAAITSVIPSSPAHDSAELAGTDRGATRALLMRQAFGRNDEKSWQPEHLRPVPPLMCCREGELLWMNPRLRPPEGALLVWDGHMGSGDSCCTRSQAQVRRYLERASSGDPLTEEQRAGLKELLAADVGLTDECDPEQLAAIMEADLHTGWTVLDASAAAGRVDRFLATVADASFYLLSFSMVSALIRKHVLPRQFTSMYISQAMEEIHSLEPGSQRDAFVSAMARLIRVLMVRQTDVMREVLFEIQVFCLAFHKNKHVARLYQGLFYTKASQALSEAMSKQAENVADDQAECAPSEQAKNAPKNQENKTPNNQVKCATSKQGKNVLNNQVKNTPGKTAKNTANNQAKCALNKQQKTAFNSQEKNTLNNQVKNTLNNQVKCTPNKQGKNTLSNQVKSTPNKPAKNTPNNQAKTTPSKQAKNVSNNQVKNTPNSQVKNTPNIQVKNTLKNQAKNTPNKQAKNTPNKQNKITPNNQPKNTAKNQGKNKANNQSKNTPSNQSKGGSNQPQSTPNQTNPNNHVKNSSKKKRGRGKKR